jgi:5-methylthioadenosine/S-adenosylhomocysteine deaminase
MFDLLVKDAFVVSLGKKLHVGVKDGKIAYLGEEEKPAKEVLRAEGKLLFPSFANMHTHLPMTLLRGLGADLPLMDWLQKVIWKLEGEFVSPEFVKDGTTIALAEGIRSGTTLFMDMYFFEEVVGEVAKEVGVRVGLGFGILDFPTKVAKTPEEYIQRAKEFVKAFKGEELVFPVLCPHAPYTCGPSTLRKVYEIAGEEDVYIHTHLAETQEEVERIKETYGNTPVMHLERLGILDQRWLCAHVVWTTEEEREILKEREVKVLHCPESNLKLASGIAPIWDYVKRGIHVCLGTDGPASNDNLNMHEEMSLMAKLQKGASLDAKAMNAQTALMIATENGFRAVGIKGGKIEEGYDADFILVNADAPHWQPLYEPISQWVYSANAEDIDTVVCKGKILMEKRELKTIDQEKVKFLAQKWREKILGFMTGRGAGGGASASGAEGRGFKSPRPDV